MVDVAGTLINQFPVKPLEGRQSISSWLLEQLDLDDRFSSVRLPGGKNLDFQSALLPYCYLTQDDIDRHIIQPVRFDAARLVTLKLLLNLTTPERERLNGTIRDVDNEIERRRRHAQLIKDFLSESEATNHDALIAKINVLERAESDAASRLANWRNDTQAASKLADHERQRIIDARKAVSDAETMLDGLRRQHEGAQERLTACREALEALTELEERSSDQRVTLRLAYTSNCPVCEHDISKRIPMPGHCNLCGELLAGEKHPSERKRLELAYSDAKDKESSLAIAVNEADGRAQAARIALKTLIKEVDDRARDVVTPYVDAIAQASADLARIRGELASLERIGDSHNRLRKEFGDIAALEEQQKQRRSQAIEGDQVESLENVLDDLNEIFRKIVRGIELPHATGQARLDPETLLPLVDEQKFAQRGGGARSAVSIAYSLTLLTYTVENALARLPGLLIIDSPQKNFGSNKDDKGLAHRVYESFLDNALELKNFESGRFYRQFQLIIIDNDVHSDIRRRIKVHQFTHEEGFIRGLADPHRTSGRGVQLTLGNADEASEAELSS